MTNQNDWFPHINPEKCNGCGDCVAQCPTDALGWHDHKATLLHPERCVYCATCEDICPTNAIELPFLIVQATEKVD